MQETKKMQVPGHGNPLQNSCLGNPMDRGAWWVIVHRVAKSWVWLKWLSTHTLNTIFFCHISFYSSVQFSSSIVSDSLWPHGLQHARPPCPSPTPGVYSNSCPLNQWRHPAISFSVISLSSCLQSFPASGSFPMSQLFASGGQICVCVCVCVYTTYLIYLFISWWHSGRFYILTMVNCAAMEHVHLRCMYLIWNSVFIFFSYIPKSGIQIKNSKER